ncbi:MAG: ion transporter [Bacteroidales bacterium]|nr:ion transporter [Bacteroidales bacterium]
MFKKISEVSKLITESSLFQNFIVFLILFSAVVIGLETYSGFVKKFHHELLIADRIIIAFFSLEIILKILAQGRKPLSYFKDGWNVFDFIIVAVCLIPAGDTHIFAVLRILRVLRVFRMITALPKLKLIVSALLRSIPSMGYVIVLIGLLFYVYAIVGVFAFGEKDPFHFGNLHYAMITLFKILTLEGWVEIMDVIVIDNSSGSPKVISYIPFFYFASFILIGAMIVMNLFIGVIINSMEESQKEMLQEKKSKMNISNTDDMYEIILQRIEELTNEIKNLKNNNSQ